MLTVEKFVCGPYSANAYIVTDDYTGKSILIDAPYESIRLIDALTAIKYDLSYILITHRHIDHIAGLHKAKSLTGSKVYIHKLDECGLYDAKANLAQNLRFDENKFYPERADGVFDDEITQLKFGTYTIKVMNTPGHTSGSVCYFIDDLLFSGDTLFKGSIGRTDFPTGNEKNMMDSLRQLYLIEDNYKLYPGHGEESTLDHEKFNNPYMQKALIL